MKTKLKVKLCGFSETTSLQCAIDCGADFIGFVFCDKSPRNVTPTQAQELAKIIPSSVQKVAVVMDADFSLLQDIALHLQPQYFQLHGTETPQRVSEIKKAFPTIKIIKAFAIKQKHDLEQSVDFIDLADIFLFDNIAAGSGKNFDFKILQNFSCEKKWFLAGGLNINNINEALQITGAEMIDISSGLEKERGKKSPELIKEFMRELKKC